jgi:hypothetical protein
MAKADHAANAAVVKVFISHLLCVLVVHSVKREFPRGNAKKVSGDEELVV